MNKFYFGGSDSSDSGDDNLPYPKPLTRASFLTPDFEPTTFLSSLRNRHQTLEDLRAELRSRSQDLNKELLDLVNENYQDFLSLGSSLQGGEEKVEEVRLGFLGFRREVQGLKDKVDERKKEIEGFITRRKAIRQEIQLGRTLLDIDQRLQKLEQRLMIVPSKSSEEEPEDGESVDLSDSEDESEDERATNIPTSRLQRHSEQFLYIQKLADKIGPDHPFIIKQQERMMRLKYTVLLDLNSALKQSMGVKDEARIMRILSIYRGMDEAEEAVKVLKALKT
ncbi:MAG: hypothetical protein Q9191_002025 [Dirinaria sp. TL-2023a]